MRGLGVEAAVGRGSVPLVFALSYHHLLSRSESLFTYRVDVVIEEARCGSKRRNPPFGENVFFPSGPIGPWFSWGAGIGVRFLPASHTLGQVRSSLGFLF